MYICFKTNLLGCMKWISKWGEEGGLLPRNDFQTGGLMEGRGVVRREVGFNTERFYAKTTVRLEFPFKAEISTK